MPRTNEQRLGPGGFCICPKCGYKKGHYPNVPCLEEKCPKCGSKLMRENGVSYQKLLKNRSEKK
jgi:hypothetical protein